MKIIFNYTKPLLTILFFSVFIFGTLIYKNKTSYNKTYKFSDFKSDSIIRVVNVSQNSNLSDKTKFISPVFSILGTNISQFPRQTGVQEVVINNPNDENISRIRYSLDQGFSWKEAYTKQVRVFINIDGVKEIKAVVESLSGVSAKRVSDETSSIFGIDSIKDGVLSVNPVDGSNINKFPFNFSLNYSTRSGPFPPGLSKYLKLQYKFKNSNWQDYSSEVSIDDSLFQNNSEGDGSFIVDTRAIFEIPGSINLGGIASKTVTYTTLSPPKPKGGAEPQPVSPTPEEVEDVDPFTWPRVTIGVGDRCKLNGSFQKCENNINGNNEVLIEPGDELCVIGVNDDGTDGKEVCYRYPYPSLENLNPPVLSPKASEVVNVSGPWEVEVTTTGTDVSIDCTIVDKLNRLINCNEDVFDNKIVLQDGDTICVRSVDDSNNISEMVCDTYLYSGDDAGIASAPVSPTPEEARKIPINQWDGVDISTNNWCRVNDKPCKEEDGKVIVKPGDELCVATVVDDKLGEVKCYEYTHPDINTLAPPYVTIRPNDIINDTADTWLIPVGTFDDGATILCERKSYGETIYDNCDSIANSSNPKIPITNGAWLCLTSLKGSIRSERVCHNYVSIRSSKDPQLVSPIPDDLKDQDPSTWPKITVGSDDLCKLIKEDGSIEKCNKDSNSGVKVKPNQTICVRAVEDPTNIIPRIGKEECYRYVHNSTEKLQDPSVQPLPNIVTSVLGTPPWDIEVIVRNGDAKLLCELTKGNNKLDCSDVLNQLGKVSVKNGYKLCVQAIKEGAKTIVSERVCYTYVTDENKKPQSVSPTPEEVEDVDPLTWPTITIGQNDRCKLNGSFEDCESAKNGNGKVEVKPGDELCVIGVNSDGTDGQEECYTYNTRNNGLKKPIFSKLPEESYGDGPWSLTVTNNEGPDSRVECTITNSLGVIKDCSDDVNNGRPLNINKGDKVCAQVKTDSDTSEKLCHIYEGRPNNKPEVSPTPEEASKTAIWDSIDILDGETCSINNAPARPCSVLENKDGEIDVEAGDQLCVTALNIDGSEGDTECYTYYHPDKNTLPAPTISPLASEVDIEDAPWNVVVNDNGGAGAHLNCKIIRLNKEINCYEDLANGKNLVIENGDELCVMSVNLSDRTTSDTTCEVYFKDNKLIGPKFLDPYGDPLISGDYDFRKFPLKLVLFNPESNPKGSKVHFKVNDGDFYEYSFNANGYISIGFNTEICAKTVLNNISTEVQCHTYRPVRK